MFVSKSSMENTLSSEQPGSNRFPPTLELGSRELRLEEKLKLGAFLVLGLSHWLSLGLSVHLGLELRSGLRAGLDPLLDLGLTLQSLVNGDSV